MIMANLKAYIEIQRIQSFKSEIHRGAGKILDFSKTLTSLSGMFTSLEEIQTCIEEFRTKLLDGFPDFPIP